MAEITFDSQGQSGIVCGCCRLVVHRYVQRFHGRGLGSLELKSDDPEVTLCSLIMLDTRSSLVYDKLRKGINVVA